MLKLPGLIVNFSICYALRQHKGAMTGKPVIVKNRFLQETFKVLWSVPREFLEGFDKMGLVEKIVFVTDFRQ